MFLNLFKTDLDIFSLKKEILRNIIMFVFTNVNVCTHFLISFAWKNSFGLSGNLKSFIKYLESHLNQNLLLTTSFSNIILFAQQEINGS